MHVYRRSSCTMFVKPKESLRYSIHTHQSQHIPAEGNQERVNGRNDPSQILMACIYSVQNTNDAAISSIESHEFAKKTRF